MYFPPFVSVWLSRATRLNTMSTRATVGISTGLFTLLMSGS